jgi:hypothetical protein
MKHTILVLLFALSLLSTQALSQNAATRLSSVSSSQPERAVQNAISDVTNRHEIDVPSSPVQPNSAQPPKATAHVGLGDKFRYYLSETYFNPGTLTAPAFRAGLRMAKPPGKGVNRYPTEWKLGAEAFGRNYGDAFAERATFQTARFATAVFVHEDPRYIASRSQSAFARSLHALSFAFVDRSDSGHRRPALSNFVGATAAGFVGNAYLPAGFNNPAHAGQRATIRFGLFAAGNLFREFAPQIPAPMRRFFMLIAR